jgi:hypothetical protein
MVYSERINWQYGVNLDGINRGMTMDEIKQVLVRNTKNSKWSARIQSLDAKYIRKAVGLVMGWTRGNRKRYSRRRIIINQNQTETPVAATPRKRVTFRIGGCEVTVPVGMTVEVV